MNKLTATYVGLFLYTLASCFAATTFFLHRDRVLDAELVGGSGQPDDGDFPAAATFCNFVWLVIDGWPVRYARPTIDGLSEHAHVWGVDVPGAKYSHAIYSSMLTGLPPSANLRGQPVAVDSLLDAARRAHRCAGGRGRLHYIGPHWSFLAVSDRRRYDDVTVVEEPLDQPYEHAFPFFFEQQAPWLRSHDVRALFAQQLADGAGSLIAHSAVFDHRQHGDFADSNAFTSDDDDDSAFSWSKQLAGRINQDMLALAQLMDELLPDHLLILTSDHGVDARGLTGYTIHGESSRDNCGFLLVYNKRLLRGAPGNGQLINVVDVAATLAGYLGAGPPAHSIGMSHAYPLPRTGHVDLAAAARRALVLHANVEQLQRAAAERLLDVPPPPPLLLDSSVAALTAHVDQLEAHARAVAAQLLAVSSEAPWPRLLLYAAVLAVLVVWTVLQLNPGLERIVLADSWLALHCQLFSLLLLYGPWMMQLLSVWQGWTDVMHRGALFKCLSPVLALFIGHRLHSLALFEQRRCPPAALPLRRPPAATATLPALDDNDSDNDAQTSPPVKLLQHAVGCLYRCEMWNVATVFCRDVLGELADGIDVLPVPLLLLLGGSVINGYVRACRCYSPHAQRWQVACVLLAVLLTSAYHYTADVAALHWLPGGVHLFVGVELAALGGYAAWLLQRAVVDRAARSLHVANVWIPVQLLLLLLSHQSSQRLLFLSLLPHVFTQWLWPICTALLKLLPSLHSDDTDDDDDDAAASALHDCSLAVQALSLYMVNTGLLNFTAGLGERFDFSVQPLVGRIGTRDYGAHPLVSSALMAAHKFGSVVVLLPLLAFAANRLPWPVATSSRAQLLSAVASRQRRLAQPQQHCTAVVWLFAVGWLCLAYYLKHTLLPGANETSLPLLLAVGGAAAVHHALEAINAATVC